MLEPENKDRSDLAVTGSTLAYEILREKIVRLLRGIDLAEISEIVRSDQ